MLLGNGLGNIIQHGGLGEGLGKGLSASDESEEKSSDAGDLRLFRGGSDVFLFKRLSSIT